MIGEGTTTMAARRELVFLILQYLEEDKYMETVHRSVIFFFSFFVFNFCTYDCLFVRWWSGFGFCLVAKKIEKI